MNTGRVSLGFDLRINPGEREGEQTRERHFLDPHQTSLISADPAVWQVPEKARELWTGLLPNFLNPLYLATDLRSLVDAYDRKNISTSGLWPICVTSDSTITISLKRQFGPGYFEHQPAEENLLSEGWGFRGFDVVDFNGLISGLKGCDYREPSWQELREAYNHDLNCDGLFFDSSVASHFAEVRGLEIRQHAPFIVVGVLTKEPSADF
jgi:hypothetical protein